MPTTQIESKLSSLQTWVLAGLAVVAVVVVAMIGSLSFVSYKAGEAAAQSRTQLAYLCDTTTILDDLVVAARDQIDLNFKNGTYDRLLEQGVLTQENVDAARETLVQYRVAHRRLAAAPC